MEHPEVPCVVYKWELCAQRHEPIKEDRETKSKGVTLGVPQGGPGAGSLAVLRHASVTFMLSTQKTPPSLRAPTGLSVCYITTLLYLGPTVVERAPI